VNRLIPDHVKREHRPDAVADALRTAADIARMTARWKAAHGMKADIIYQELNELRDDAAATGLWNAARAAQAAAWDALENELIARQRGPGELVLSIDDTQIHVRNAAAPARTRCGLRVFSDYHVHSDPHLRSRCEDCFDAGTD